MDLAENKRQILELLQLMTLTLDNPQSVKLQVKQISLIQKQLRAIKKEASLAIQQINQQAAQSTPDSLFSVGLDLFGKRKFAGQVRATTRKAIQADKINLRQPYLEIKEYIEQAILHGDQLKLKAQIYLSNN